MNFGIIGFGRIARKFVQAIEATDEGKIYAISSRSVSMDDPYLKEHPEVKVYKDYEDKEDKILPDLDKYNTSVLVSTKIESDEH